MKKTMTLGLVSIAASAMLVGCGGGSSNNGGNGTGNGNGGNANGNGNGGATQGYKAQFKARSIGDQVEELMGGIIGIVDEVGHGKMADPLGEDIAHADTTKVESQFSWNSTMDFYNNILSVKHVCEGGLEKIAKKVDAAKEEDIDDTLKDALSLIVAISDFDGDGKLTTSDLIANNGEMAFRNQILNAEGRAKIQAAMDKLAELQTKLETFQPMITSDATEADKAETAEVVDNVIVKGYNNLGTEAGKLETALTALKVNPTAQTVQAARDQWRATRKYWEAGEGHIFGPVDTLGVDPKVDSWPVDKTQLDGALAGWDPEFSNIDGFPVTMKGFHAIEYLLFGDGTTLEDPADAATRLQQPVGDEDTAEDKIRLQYLEALGKTFAKDIKSLTDAWK
ncbi:imelysin family protein [Sulfurovum sp.]|uniref:imelysin family protein n=1 Tax=Sulfurovum sp. TaxID=1969726 RepID=UPI0025D5F89C|nr:imelysin family protein [Sulfurovum sp.]